MMKVKDLVKHLKSGDQDAIVAAMDHFGRPVFVDEYDFSFRQYKIGDNPQGVTGWYLIIPVVDIGPEPE